MNLLQLADAELLRLYTLVVSDAVSDEVKDWARVRIQAMQDRFFGEETEKEEV